MLLLLLIASSERASYASLEQRVTFVCVSQAKRLRAEWACIVVVVVVVVEQRFLSCLRQMTHKANCKSERRRRTFTVSKPTVAAGREKEGTSLPATTTYFP